MLINEEAASDNTALMHRGQAPRSAEDDEDDNSDDNLARLSLATRFAALHLSLSGSLMQERYMPVTIPKKVLYVPRPQRPVVEVNLIKLLEK